MKNIIKFIRAIRNKYYSFMLDLCDLGLEEAKLNGEKNEEVYWVNRYNKYLTKFKGM